MKEEIYLDLNTGKFRSNGITLTAEGVEIIKEGEINLALSTIAEGIKQLKTALARG